MQERDEKRLAEILANYLDRTADGLPPDPDEVLREHPDLMEEMETLLEIDEALRPPAALPERLSGHRILREIGSGGMGVVLLAKDERLGRDVAVKVLNPRYADNPELKTRFMREARAMARITHPNIARIYSLGPADEPPHFVMEYVEGGPLTRVASSLNFHQKAELMYKVLLAVAFLHENGILHRDLKPANILVTPDLEPKLLDFGLALDAGTDQNRLSRAGEIAGTPEYLSPEQTQSDALDARSDVFSAGVVLYEMLSGNLPFSGATLRELIRAIREDDPVLPARKDRTVPRELQNVCLKALEKDPARRYASAREMAADLQRFLAGEAVLAEPGAYSRVIGQEIEQHLRDIDAWRRDQIISDMEYDGLRHRYAALADREDAWIMEARRLTVPQVSLYLGMWVLSVGAALLTIFRYPMLTGTAAVIAALAGAVPAGCIGIHHWRRGRPRIAIAFLLAFCLLLPLAVLVGMEEYGLAGGFTQNRSNLELFSALSLPKPVTNAQIWWAILLTLPVFVWLRRFTGAAVFTLVLAAGSALFALAWLLRLGLIEWLAKDPGRFYFHLIPVGALYMLAGMFLERKRHADDARYVYPFGVLFTWAALSGLAAFHKPYADWLRNAAPWTRGQQEYLFILNAAVYFALDRICEALRTPQLRVVGKAFRFVIPGHVLTSLLLLGLDAKSQNLRHEATLFEWLLPAAACAFVFASIPKQMKNFFASGLLFLAVGIVRLQREYFKDQAIWPLALLAGGMGLMLAAVYYAPLRLLLGRLWKRPLQRLKKT